MTIPDRSRKPLRAGLGALLCCFAAFPMAVQAQGANAGQGARAGQVAQPIPVAQPAPAIQRALPADAAVVLTHPDYWAGEARVGTYISSGWGFSTSSYWIEGPDGLILIDTQFLPSAAEEFVNWAEAATGKKAKLAIVLHANPDKFNGTATLQKRGIKVVTSDQVLAAMPPIHEKRVAAFYDRYEPDYPKELPKPDSFGGATTTLSAGGVTVRAHVMGPGCSEAHVVVEFEGHLFVGDLIGSGSHSWLEIGRTDEWLKRLDEMAKLEPKFIHPGRGPSGDETLIDTERTYLKTVIAEVAKEKPKGEPSDAALERIGNRLEAAFPGYRFDVFLRIGLPAEWRRQAAAAATPAKGATPAKANPKK